MNVLLAESYKMGGAVPVDPGFATSTPEHGEPMRTPRTREPVARAMQVMTWMVEAGGRDLALRDIATGLGIPLSSAHRLLHLLQQAAMVTKEAGGSYSLAMEFYRLAWKAVGNHGVREVALPHLRALVERIEETALLGVYDETRRQMMLVVSVETQQHLRYVTDLHQWMPMTYGSTGFGITSFLPEEVRERIIGGELAGEPEAVRESIRSEIQRTRRRGYAYFRREHPPATIGLSVPIWGSGARVIGDVFVGLPGERFDQRREQTLVGEIQRAAAGITADLGGRPDPALPLDTAAWSAYTAD